MFTINCQENIMEALIIQHCAMSLTGLAVFYISFSVWSGTLKLRP